MLITATSQRDPRSGPASALHYDSLLQSAQLQENMPYLFGTHVVHFAQHTPATCKHETWKTPHVRVLLLFHYVLGARRNISAQLLEDRSEFCWVLRPIKVQAKVP